VRNRPQVTGHRLQAGAGVAEGTPYSGVSADLYCRLLPVACRLLTAMTLVIAVSACSNVQPWVKPYERAAFADPIMAANPNPVSGSYINHVREAREGARGATGVAGGGCGCN
jgi:hypothetical protein